jgi:fructoselysine-6-P-deglycase FrlB-like protein
MTEMIAAEPALAGRLLRRLAERSSGAARLAEAVRSTAERGDPIVVTGCGTSEHAALAIVEILDGALDAAGTTGGPGRVVAAQAFELSLRPPRAGLCIGVSHDGGTAATNRALEAARAAGARTAIVTVTERSPAGRLAELAVPTGERDESWCHTVGYLSPILAAAAVAGHITGRAPDAEAATRLLASGLHAEAEAEAMAAAIGKARHVVVVASGADRPAGRELVLKLEEASWTPSAYRDLETFLHGHMPATGGETALIVILADRESRPERVARTRQLLAGIRIVEVPTAAIVARDVSAELDDSLTSAGRLLVDEAPGLSAPLAALLGTAVPLQLLTERVARDRATNPDLIRRDDPRYRDAAATAR